MLVHFLKFTVNGMVFCKALTIRCFSIVKIAEELRKGVYEDTGLTCSAGVAPNRLLAKVLLVISWFIAI